MTVHKNGDASLGSLLSGRYRLFAIIAFAGALASTGSLIASYRRRGADGARVFWLSVAMNLVTVALVSLVAETAIRLLSSRTPADVVFAGTTLLPRSWTETVARYRKLLMNVPDDVSYFVPDTLLGWTPGPNRQSRDGMYATSAEGIRSARPDTSYSVHRPRHRIALVGDSYTFGLEVSYEDSWARQLERALGPDFQILNFGVDGYGVDQSYLRYVRDVRPWHPDLVVLGFASHDLRRTMAVYIPVSFPEWGFPFAKPRFVLDAGQLKLLNVPLLSPESLLSRGSVGDLPMVEYDPAYDRDDWRWRWYHASYLVRFLSSRFPHYQERAPQDLAATSVAALKAVNTALMISFAELAVADGSVPLIVYTPSREDFSGSPQRQIPDRTPRTAVLQALRERGIDYLDLRSCFIASRESVVFVADHRHYSPEGGAAIARCLRPVLAERLARAAR